MAVQTVVKTIGTTGVFSTFQLWEDGAPTSLPSSEKSAAGTFAVAAFTQGESLTFVGSGATGKFLHTDSTAPGNGTYVIYGLLTGNPAASDVVTGDASTATCTLSSGTPTDTGVIWEGQCQNEAFSGAAEQLTFAGSTNSATCYKHLTTASGASFRNHASVQTNALRFNASNGASITTTNANTVAINVNDDYVRLSQLQIAATGTGGRGVDFTGNAINAYLDWCIVEGKYVATSAAIGVVMTRASGCVLRNSCIIQRASGADHIVATDTQSPAFYNCTIVAADDLATAPVSVVLSGASGSPTFTNCALFAGADVPTAAGSATFTFTTCVGDDSTPATGISTLQMSGEFENVNDATRDFRLKSGANSIDIGTTDTTNAAIDIAGTARPSGAAYDVGCWEFIAAAGGVTGPLINSKHLSGGGILLGGRLVS